MIIPDSSYVLIRNTSTTSTSWSENHRAKSGLGQLVVGTEFNNWRRARAGQHHLVNLPFADLRQLAYVAAGLHDVVSRNRLCRITGELVKAVEYRT